MKNYVIILASGSGKRFNSNLPKQFLEINGKSILEQSIECFENNSDIDKIILVIHPDYKDSFKTLISKNNYKKIEKILAGGETRFQSSFNGISAIKDKEANVLIHDAVRPFVKTETISKCIKALDKYNAVNLCIPLTDSIIKTNDKKFVEDVPLRESFMLVQTPQAFKLSLIKKAYDMAMEKKDFSFTDDCSLIIHFNLDKVYIVEGDINNIKITYSKDIK